MEKYFLVILILCDIKLHKTPNHNPVVLGEGVYAVWVMSGLDLGSFCAFYRIAPCLLPRLIASYNIFYIIFPRLYCKLPLLFFS